MVGRRRVSNFLHKLEVVVLMRIQAVHTGFFVYLILRTARLPESERSLKKSRGDEIRQKTVCD